VGLIVCLCELQHSGAAILWITDKTCDMMKTEMHWWVQTCNPYFFCAGLKHVVYGTNASIDLALCGEVEGVCCFCCFGCLC
jgi:hypothetical protein